MVLLTFFFYLLRTCNKRKPVQDAFYKLSHYRSPELTRKMTNLSVLDCVAVVDVRIVSCLQATNIPSASLFISYFEILWRWKHWNLRT